MADTTVIDDVFSGLDQGDCRIFSLPGMAEISAIPTGNGRNLDIPTGNRIPQTGNDKCPGNSGTSGILV